MTQSIIEVPVANRAFAVTRGRRLEYFTIIWNCLESMIALGAGLIAGSIAWGNLLRLQLLITLGKKEENYVGSKSPIKC